MSVVLFDREMSVQVIHKGNVENNRGVHEVEAFGELATQEYPDITSDETWQTLYPALQSLANYLVNIAPLPCWRGQEAEIAADLVQETLKKLFERAQKAVRGEAVPIHSLKQMMSVVAYNCCRDLKRRERRLTRMETLKTTYGVYREIDAEELIFDDVIEQVYQEELFSILAEEIARFPKKQQAALLTDLANRMSFDVQPTPLQKAFRAVGIELQQYQHALPDDERIRSQHISLSSQAYKRVAHLPRVHAHIEALQEQANHA